MGWIWVLVSCAVFASVPAAARAGMPHESHEGSLFSTRRMPRQSLDAERIPANVSIITADDIRRSKALTIQQLLLPLTGVTFSDQQGFGLASDGTLNLRGVVNSSRTNALVLVDGIRQNRLTGDEVHWQSIPVEQIERIEVIRGGGGLVYGEGALTGVINIITKQDGDRPARVETGGELGSFGWKKTYAGAQGRMAPLRYGLYISRREVDAERESSWSRNTTVRSNSGIDWLPGLTTDLHVAHSDDTTAFPGLLTLAQSQQRSEQSNAFHGFNTTEIDQVSLDTTLGPVDGLSGVLSAFWSRQVQKSEDSINFNSFTVTPSHGVSLRTNHELAGASVGHLLVSGIELSEDKATTGDPGVGPDNETNRTGYGLFLEETLMFGDRFTLVGGMRYDRSRYQTSLSFPDYNGTLRFEGWSPKIGATLILVPQQLRAFASYSRPFKAPNVDDFSARVSTIGRSNAALQPQQADTYEIGLTGRLGGVEADATGFYLNTNDEILYNNTVFTNQNFDTRRFGCELGLRAHPLNGRARTSIAYTYVDSEFTKGALNGHTIPGSPEHTLHTVAGISPLEDLWVDLDWRLVSRFRRINDFANILPAADNYGVLNLITQYDVPQRLLGERGPHMNVYLRIENVTNEEYAMYQSSNSVNLLGAGEAPMPPRGFFGGVHIRF